MIIPTVDAGALINVYETARDRRTRDMLMKRQIEREDREIERQTKRDEIMARLWKPNSPKGGDPASGGSAPAVTAGAGASGIADAYSSGIPEGPPPPRRLNEDGSFADAAPAVGGPVAPSALVDPAELPPRTDGLVVNQDALRELYALDPKSAMELQKSVFDMNKAQAEAVAANGERLASAAFRLKSLPPEERAGELRLMAPMLAQMGIDASRLDAADLSDRGLDRYIMMGRSIKDVVAEAQKDREFEARERDRAEDNVRADRGLAIRQGALDLARGREGRIASGKGGSGGGGADVSGLSTADLIRMAGGGD